MVTVLRTGPEIGVKSAVRRERKGFMVAVGWEGPDHGEYEVVDHLPDYRMTCFRKLSDDI